MPTRLNRNKIIFRMFAGASTKDRNRLLSTVNEDFIFCCHDCSRNILEGNVFISAGRKLQPFKTTVRRLESPKFLGIKCSRKLLQKGGLVFSVCLRLFWVRSLVRLCQEFLSVSWYGRWGENILGWKRQYRSCSEQWQFDRRTKSNFVQWNFQKGKFKKIKLLNLKLQVYQPQKDLFSPGCGRALKPFPPPFKTKPWC